MKKLSLIVTTVIALTLITAACNISFTPPVLPPGPPPIQPQPGQPQPEQPQLGQPQPGQPQPGQPQPGQPGPEQPQPGLPEPEQPQPNQPQPVPQQPNQPPDPNPVQPTATKKSGGGQPAPTATMIMLQAVTANLDLAVSNVYPSSTGHIMVTLKNAGNIKISGSYKVTCSGSYTDSTGNNALKSVAQYATVNLTAGQTTDFDTSYSRNPSITEMWVSCKVTPPQGDTNSSDDSLYKQVK